MKASQEGNLPPPTRKWPKLTKLRWAWILFVGTVIITSLLVGFLRAQFDRLRKQGWTELSIRPWSDAQVAIGTDGTVWLGRMGQVGRLTKIGRQYIFAMDLPVPNSSSVHIYDMVADEQGTLWIATSQGLFTLRPGEAWHVYTQRNSAIVSDLVLALAVGEDGGLWIGTAEGVNLITLEGEWLTFAPHEASLRPVNVEALAIDQQGRVWMGSPRGLGVLKREDSQIFADITLPQGVSADINALAVDRRNQLWVVGCGAIGVREAAGGWKVFSPAEHGLEGRCFAQVAVDNENSIWVAGNGGVNQYHASTGWTAYDARFSGLPSDRFSDLIIAPDGQVVIVTQSSLSFFNPAESADMRSLRALHTVLDITETARCLTVFAIVILAIASIIRHSRSRSSANGLRPESVDALSPSVALRMGRRLAKRGDQGEAVRYLMRAALRGVGNVRKRAIRELETLGEVESF